jgi:hypothetical protein
MHVLESITTRAETMITKHPHLPGAGFAHEEHVFAIIASPEVDMSMGRCA